MSDSHPAPGSWEDMSDKPSSSVSFALFPSRRSALEFKGKLEADGRWLRYF